MRAAVDAVAAGAQRLMSIYTPDLEPELYDQNSFLEIVKRFVLARRFAKVRVLLSDSGRLLRDNNRFVAMGRRLTSCIDIRPAAVPAKTARRRLSHRRRPRHRVPRERGALGRRGRSQQSAGGAPVSRRVRRDLAREFARRTGAPGLPLTSFPVNWNPEVTVAAIVAARRADASSWSKNASAASWCSTSPRAISRMARPWSKPSIRETREETAWRLHPEALVGIYLWRNPDNGRTFLRFAFCGIVDDHQPAQPLDTGIVRALWLSHEQLLAQTARLRSPLVLRCLDDYLLGKRQPLETVASAGSRDGPAGGRRRQPVGAVFTAYNSRRARSPRHPRLRTNRRRHVRRRRLRRRRAVAQARRPRGARAVHEQLGGRRLLLHGRAGLPGCARRRAPNSASPCIA